MGKHKFQIWKNSLSGPYEIEVEANNQFDGEKIAMSRENCQQKEIMYRGPVSSSSSSSSSGSGSGSGSLSSLPNISGGGLIFLFGIFLFFSYAEWILMFIGGLAGTWISKKVIKTSDESIFLIILIAILSGGIGFWGGNSIKESLNEESSSSQVKYLQIIKTIDT